MTAAVILLLGIQSPTQITGQEVFDAIMQKAKSGNWAKLPMSELMGKVATELLGTPYVGFTLENNVEVEVCTVNLKGLDCVTFFESTLGIARMLKKGGNTFEGLAKEVRFTRYRGGEQTDYTSRLHYTLDWMYDNQRKGAVSPVTDLLPESRPFEFSVNFMSTKPANYKQLAKMPALIPTIQKFEGQINARGAKYIPIADVEKIEGKLQTGDIVGITTDGKGGIDISHTGLVFVDSKIKRHFMDASSIHKKVTLEPSLGAYIGRSKKATGIIVVRPIAPK